MEAIAIGASVAGPLIGGIEQRGSLRRQARIDEENGRLALYQGELDAQQTRRDERLMAGAALAAAAADGNALGTGSIADLIEQSALEREREILEHQIRARAENANYRAAAKDKRRAGDMALVQGAIGAVAAGAGGVSNSRGSARLSAARAKDRASEAGSLRDTRTDKEKRAASRDALQSPYGRLAQASPSFAGGNAWLPTRRRLSVFRGN